MFRTGCFPPWSEAYLFAESGIEPRGIKRWVRLGLRLPICDRHKIALMPLCSKLLYVCADSGKYMREGITGIWILSMGPAAISMGGVPPHRHRAPRLSVARSQLRN